VCPKGNFFLDESSVGLKLSLYPEFQLPMCLGTGLKVCVVVLKPNLVFRFRHIFSFSLAWPELNNSKL
jgi:hypothetical protein